MENDGPGLWPKQFLFNFMIISTPRPTIENVVNPMLIMTNYDCALRKSKFASTVVMCTPFKQKKQLAPVFYLIWFQHKLAIEIIF